MKPCISKLAGATSMNVWVSKLKIEQVAYKLGQEKVDPLGRYSSKVFPAVEQTWVRMETNFGSRVQQVDAGVAENSERGSPVVSQIPAVSPSQLLQIRRIKFPPSQQTEVYPPFPVSSLHMRCSPSPVRAMPEKWPQSTKAPVVQSCTTTPPVEHKLTPMNAAETILGGLFPQRFNLLRKSMRLTCPWDCVGPIMVQGTGARALIVQINAAGGRGGNLNQPLGVKDGLFLEKGEVIKKLQEDLEAVQVGSTGQHVRQSDWGHFPFSRRSVLFSESLPYAVLGNGDRPLNFTQKTASSLFTLFVQRVLVQHFLGRPFTRVPPPS
jgi:hypothetical protein